MSKKPLINGDDRQLTDWSQINWRKVRKVVKNLRCRIFRARKLGQWKQLRRLQKLLIRSLSNLLLSVRQITQVNDGKRTAGIDKEVINTPAERVKLVNEWKMPKVSPVKRVYIPKSNGKKRPLGIPTVRDRVAQAIVKNSLEPEWEAVFEPNSYGFRPARSVHDAIEAIYITISQKPKYVLDADISKCFDCINHEKLLAKLSTFPLVKREIRAWLKSGFILDKELFPTNEGTPQGGVISPLLANIALHGMETELKNLTRAWKGSKSQNEKALTIVRYADDFVVLHKELDKLNQCKEVIENWLAEIGLKLKPSKTRISHTLEEYEGNVGFDFLGFNIRQYRVGKTHSGANSTGKLLGFKTIIKPSKDNIVAHIKRTGDIIKKYKSLSQAALIRELNPIIRGWSNYYSTVCSKDTYSLCDHLLYHQLKRWAERRHPNKNKSWVANKYWHTSGNRKWVFSTQDGIKLLTHSETPIVRHIKVKGEKSPFDGDWLYWTSRLGKHPEISNSLAKLLKKQKGKCNHCGLNFKLGEQIEIDHIKPKSLGGNNSYNNLQALHKHCHDQKTANDGSLTRIHDREFVGEEPYEAKVSRTVLKTS